jgi:predicted O-linked N-acetylglucosamine transferase (SPINDLY family)
MADCHGLLGLVLADRGLAEQAISSYRQALRLNPDSAEVHANLGNVFLEQGKADEAIGCYRRAIALKPDFVNGHDNLGIALTRKGQPDEAIASFRRAIALKPDDAFAYNQMGNSLKDQGKLEEAIAGFRRAIELKPDFARAHSNLVFALPFCPGYDARAIHEGNRLWDRRYAAPLAGSIQPHPNDRSPDRRLRIGYISPNFCNHCQAYFTVPLFAAHDHENFEIFCYSDVVRPDDLTARLRSCADAWRNIVGLGHEHVARMIRVDEVDVLIDLTMHMGRDRLLVFARKPAPVQVCWLAYPGTTGLSAMDYRITDPYLDPPGLDDRWYSEESIRLPDCFWCYDPLATWPPVNALPALSSGRITFGSLNNFCKVNDGVLEAWGRILKAVDRSRLIMLAPRAATAVTFWTDSSGTASRGTA